MLRRLLIWVLIKKWRERVVNGHFGLFLGRVKDG